jgi:hypothetical protein
MTNLRTASSERMSEGEFILQKINLANRSRGFIFEISTTRIDRPEYFAIFFAFSNITF